MNLDDFFREFRPKSTFEELAACRTAAEAITLASYGEPVPVHVAECGRCARRLAETTSFLGSLSFPAPRGSFAGLRWRRRTLRPLVAAGIAAALSLAFFVTPARRPAPLEGLRRGVEALPTAKNRGLAEALALAKAMNGADSTRSYAAIRELRRFETPAAEEILAEGLGRYPSRDRWILQALIELRSRRATPWLLRDPLHYAGDLARIGDPAAIAPLASQLPLQPEAVGAALSAFPRDELLAVAGGLQDPSWLVAVPSLHEYVLSRPEFRDSACRAALRSGAAGAEFLIRAGEFAMLSRMKGTREALLRALRDSSLRPQALRAIAELRCRDLGPELRRGKIPPSEAAPVLARLDDRESVRWLLRLLAREPDTAREALRVATPALVAKEATSLLRERKLVEPMVVALDALSNRAFGPFFLKAATCGSVRARALEALVRLDYREAVPELARYLPDDALAARTLKELTGQDFGRDRQAWDRWWRRNS